MKVPTFSESYDWHVATLLKSEMVAADVNALTFSVEDWIQHQAGQHYDIRLTSPDGYQAQRSYSIASAPEDMGIVEFGVQLLPDGEVSPYLYELKADDQIEIKGPIGGHFVWTVDSAGPLVLIGGGSGMVPLMSMLRHRFAHGDTRETHFLISAKTIDHVLYKDELEAHTQNDGNVAVTMTLTEQAPIGWMGYHRRVDKTMIKEVLGDVLQQQPLIYICGPTPFVEAVANVLVELKMDPTKIKTERFGG